MRFATVVVHHEDFEADRRASPGCSGTHFSQQIHILGYHSALSKILGDHCRAAGVLPNQVRPDLNSQQIAEVREYADRQPFLSAARREFTEAARQAEQLLREREAAQAARQAEQTRTQDMTARTREQSESRSTQRSDRDTYSRGR
jgi:hypothetical protein